MKLILIQCILLQSALGISMVPKSTGSIRQTHIDETFTASTTSTKSTDEATKGARARTDSISVRTTNGADIPTIIDILSCETNASSSPPPTFFNWNRLKSIKSKSSLTLQLTQRLAAMQAHSKYKSILMEEMKEELKEASITSLPLNILWNQDAYRATVEKAVMTTLEYNSMQETPWDEWNFALTPDKFMFFHVMMTAVDGEFQSERSDSEPVGFCEMGIVRHPNCKKGSANDKSNDNNIFIPCITNLVVSPNQRRRGIGKRMMDCAIRVVRVHGRQLNDGDECKFNSVGLYVDEDNISAMALYRQMGFQVTGTCADVNDRVFMELDMNENLQ